MGCFGHSYYISQGVCQKHHISHICHFKISSNHILKSIKETGNIVLFYLTQYIKNIISMWN